MTDQGAVRSRPLSDSRLGNEARMLASRLHRAEQKREDAQEEIDLATRELSVLYRKACKRFGRDIPADALLLDVLNQIDIEPGDVWRWRGTYNNHGTATIRIRQGRAGNFEKSLPRFLAVAFGVITEDDYGLLYPTNGDPGDVNPWHRRLRKAPEPMTGNRWRFHPQALDRLRSVADAPMTADEPGD